MNNMEYLNQISASNNPQPQKTSIGGLFSKKFIFIVSGLLVLAILLMIFGSLLGKTSNKDKHVMERLSIRINNISSITQDYGRFAKSSTMRSMNASLYSVLNSTATNFIPLANSVYEIDPSVPTEDIASEEETHLAELKEKLDYAKLNGLLDRTYSHEITLQVSLLLSLEAEAIERTKDENIKNILSESSNNLSELYGKFSQYSDASSDVNKSSN